MNEAETRAELVDPALAVLNELKKSSSHHDFMATFIILSISHLWNINQRIPLTKVSIDTKMLK